MTELLTFSEYNPSTEWRRLFKLKPSHQHEIVFGFLLRLAVAIISALVPIVVLLIVGFFNGWKVTPALVVMYGAFVFLTVLSGEHIRSRVYERSIDVRAAPKEAFREIEHFEAPPRTRSDSFALKRIIDIALSVILLVFLFPLFVSIPLAIKLGSPGPILLRRTYLGSRQKHFTGYTFRTMASDLDFVEGDAFAMTRDPRVTAVGKMLRQTKLDRLPMLINILLGEMSLVGPRPLTPSEYASLEGFRIAERYSMKPGLTGLEQVSGGSRATQAKQIACDLFYVKNWSVVLDIKILIVTIPSVLSDSGAY